MIRILVACFLILVVHFESGAQPQPHFMVDDGPYLFRDQNNFVAEWIENGNLKLKRLDPETYNELKKIFDLKFAYRDIYNSYNTRLIQRVSFRNADSIAVISDVHGEYAKYLNLLKKQNILDKNNNWSFGKGHLVILGDCFDRGDKVTELLWHIFGLERQAEKAGGMVHYILGNHEVMVLGEDLRYINEKYRKVELITGKKYQDLYSYESVLGRWLRHKPIVITINNFIFVHGGISTDLIRRKLTTEEVNNLFMQMQIFKAVESENDINNLVFLNEDRGPIWYRGYFYDNDFNEAKADSILNYFGKDHIVVGHTTSESFQTLYEKKIIGVDAGIGYKNDGAVLIIKNGTFFMGTGKGRREKL